MTDADRLALMDALGRETATVIVAELRKIDGATSGDLLIAIESVVVHALASFNLAKGKEGKLLKQMRENAMKRLARGRMVMELEGSGR